MRLGDTEALTEVQKLKDLLHSFQEPERKFVLSGGSRVTAFRFDQKNQNLFLGFKNGEIAHVDLFKIKKHDQKEEEKLNLECNFFNIGTEEKIEDIFIPERGTMIVVSKKEVFKVQIANCSLYLESSQVFSVQNNVQSKGVIKDVKLSSSHNLYYVMIEEEDTKGAPKRIFSRFQIDKTDAIDVLTRTVSKKISHFEIHKKDKNILFLIVEKEIYQFDFSHSASARDSIIKQKKMRRGKSKNNNIINMLKKNKKVTDTEGCTLYFFNAKNEFNAFKFDGSMKHFYTHDDNVFKKYLTESKMLMGSFFRHTSKLKQIEFSDDFKTIFRRSPRNLSIDVSDTVNIWNADKGELISSLNQKRKIFKIKDMKLISEGDRLVVRDENGITMWNLRKGLKNFSQPGGHDLTFSSFMIIEGGKFMMFDPGDSDLFRVEIGNDMRSESIFTFPYEMEDYQLLGSGDLIIKSEVDFSEIPAHEADHLGLMDEYDQVSKLDFFDLKYYKQNLEEPCPDPEDQADDPENEETHPKKGKQGRHFVFSTRDEITTYSIVSNKEMQFPRVFENGKLIKNSRFDKHDLKKLVKIDQPHCKSQEDITDENEEEPKGQGKPNDETNDLQTKSDNLKPDSSRIMLQTNENEQFIPKNHEHESKQESQISKTIINLGTNYGECFRVELFLDQSSNLIRRNCVRIFKDFEPDLSLYDLPSGSRKNSDNSKKSVISDKENQNQKEKEFFNSSDEQLVKPEGQENQIDFQNFSPIQDYVQFSTEQTEAVIFSKGRSTVGEAKLQYLYIYMRRLSDPEWSKTKFSLKILNEIDEDNFFKIKSMQLDLDISPALSKPLRYFLVSTLGIAIIEFNAHNHSLKLVRYHKKNLDRVNLPLYSPKQNSFYISNKNSIQIWDGSMQYLVYSIDLDHTILGVSLVDNDDHEEFLLIYNQTTYYEIELETFRLSKKIGFLGKFKSGIPCMPFNISSFPQCKPFFLPTFQDYISHIKFFTDVDTMNLNTFPFADLAECFDKEDFADPIRRYAAYYFSRINLSNFEDWFYGPLNPILFAMHHNNMSLLEEILDEYRYPRTVGSYWSPLGFAFRYNYNSSIKILCDKLIKRNYFVEFRRQDFKPLLRSSYSYAHRLLATIPWEPSLQNFPRLMYMKNSVNLRFENEVGRILYTMKRDERRIHKNRIREIESDENFELGRSSTEKTKKNLISKKEVLVYQVPFKYNFEAGSPDSILLLQAYSTSKAEEFVLSQWKELIRYKWSFSRWAHILMAILYWWFTLVVTLSIVFFPEIKFLKQISVYFIVFFVVYELLQFISYATFDISRYFTDLWNYLDWLTFMILLIYFFHFQKKPKHILNQILSIFGLIVMYYRSFSHLRVINAFTTLIGMINVIIQKLMIFFAILLYFYATTTLLLIKLESKNSKIQSLESAYVWTFFGGVEPSDFDTYSYGGIAIIFGTIIVTIVLLNVLIAFLSNLFSRLEDQQRSSDLKEKADMMLDLEVMLLFFRFKLTGKDHLLRKFEIDEELKPAKSLFPDLFKNKIKNESKGEGIQSLINGRKILFIFKTADSEELSQQTSVDDNIYKKVKQLSKDFDDHKKRSILHNKKVQLTLETIKFQMQNR